MACMETLRNQLLTMDAFAFNHETLTTCAPTNQVPITAKLLLLMLHRG
jgi:hypothetical protein